MQQTIKNPVTFEGVAFYTGEPVVMTVHPAPENSGIKFKRVDLGGEVVIPAKFDIVTHTPLKTVLTNESGKAMEIVEHIMSALYGCGIDNALVEVNNKEIPIMDGSSREFVHGLKKAQIIKQKEPRKFIKVTKKVRVENDDKFVELLPADEFEVHCEIEFDHKLIGNQKRIFNGNSSYESEIAPARTFGFLKDIEYLKTLGFNRVDYLDNAIGLDDNGIMNEGGLRFDDEFVRHKMLDTLGDLYLAGHRIIARVNTRKGGHAINNQILRELFSKPDSFEII